MWSYLEDAVILENYDQYYRDCAELGDDGIPKTEIERTPWQQLWIEWVGLEPLSYHLADWPEHVEHTLDLLERRARQTFEIAAPLARAVHRHRGQHHGVRDRPGAISQILRSPV